MAIYRRFIVQQKYVDGKPTEEYRLGIEVDGTNYHSLEACESGSECTQLEYRWVNVDSAEDYYCEGTSKYRKQKKQQRCVNEEEWTDVYPYEYRAGEIVERDSEDCGYEPSGEYHIFGATDGHGSIIISPSKEYYSSTDVVQITTIPNADYMFSNYNYGRNLDYGNLAYDSVFSLTMANNWYISASFKSAEYNIFDLTGVGGTLNISPSKEFYYKDDVVTITNTPGLNHVFSWYQYGNTDNMELSTVNNPFTHKMSGNWYISGVFSMSITSGVLYYSYNDGTESFIPWSSSWLRGSHNNGSNAVIIRDMTGVVQGLTDFSNNTNLKYIEFVSVSSTGSYTFQKCTNLTDVSLPYLSFMGIWLFSDCINLKNVYVPRAKHVNASVFVNCSTLSVLSVPNASSIWTVPFDGCDNLRDIYLLYPRVVDFYNFSIAFRGCPSDLRVHIPEPLCDDYNRRYGHLKINLKDAAKSFYEVFDCMSVEPEPQKGCLMVESYNHSISWYNPSESYIDKYMYNTDKALIISDYCGTVKIISSSAYANTGLCVMSLQEIEFPSVSYIGDSAFAGVTTLSKISLNEVKELGSRAFQDAQSLYKATMPKVENIGAYAFYRCYPLSMLDAPNVTSVGMYAFYSVHYVPINFPKLTYIGSSAFQYCYGATEAYIPKVSFIGSAAFSNCSNLSVVYLTEVTSVTKLETSKAFNNCTKLTSIIVPCSLVEDFINDSVWSYFKSKIICNEFVNIYSTTDGHGSIVVTPDLESFYKGTEVTISATPNPEYVLNYYQYGSTPAYGMTELQDPFTLRMTQNWFISANFTFHGGLFYEYSNGNNSWIRWTKSTLTKSFNSGTSATTIIDFSGTVTSIPSSGFSSCSYLEKIDFSNLQYIDSSAFYSCYNLSYANIPNVSYIGDRAFYSCSNLLTLYLPNVSYIGYGAFYECSQLSEVFMENVTNVGEAAFADTKLSYINLPNATVVGADAFIRTPLKNANLPLVSSLSGTFMYCHSLEEVNVPNVVSVGRDTFRGCYNLTKLYIPKAEYLGTVAIESCSKLSEIYLTEVSKATVYGMNALIDTYNLEAIYIPCSLMGDFLSTWPSSFHSLFQCVGESAPASYTYSTKVFSHGWASRSFSYRGANGKLYWGTDWSYKTSTRYIDYSYSTIPSGQLYCGDTLTFIPEKGIRLESDSFTIYKSENHFLLSMVNTMLYTSTDGKDYVYEMAQGVYSDFYIGYSTWENCGNQYYNYNRIPPYAVSLYCYSEVQRYLNEGLYSDNKLETIYIGTSFINNDIHFEDIFFSMANKLTSIYIGDCSRIMFLGDSYIRNNTNLKNGGIYVPISLLSFYQNEYPKISELFKERVY